MKKIKNKKIIYVVITIVVIIGLILGWKLLKPSITSESVYIKPESVYLKIDCDGKDISDTYKIGDTFKCELLGKEFTIKIKNISDKKIVLKSTSYDLYPKRSNGTISLIDEVNTFNLEKNKKLILVLQATDVSSDISIIWK